jgi:hypothetical protein
LGNATFLVAATFFGAITFSGAAAFVGVYNLLADADFAGHANFVGNTTVNSSCVGKGNFFTLDEPVVVFFAAASFTREAVNERVLTILPRARRMVEGGWKGAE